MLRCNGFLVRNNDKLPLTQTGEIVRGDIVVIHDEAPMDMPPWGFIKRELRSADCSKSLRRGHAYPQGETVDDIFATLDLQDAGLPPEICK